MRLDNEAETLESAVLSIIERMKIPYEILLLDDGESTDDTSQIAAALAEQYPAVVHVLRITPDDDWCPDNYNYRWNIKWDGNLLMSAYFSQKLHELPLATSKETVLSIPDSMGISYVHRSD
jgi:hypothetical protein